MSYVLLILYEDRLSSLIDSINLNPRQDHAGGLVFRSRMMKLQ